MTDSVLIVVGLPVASPGALPQAIVALGVKKTFLVKPGKLELMIHIGRKNKVILTRNQLPQLPIWPAGCDVVPVDIDLPRPPCPIFLQGIIGVKPPEYISEIPYF